MSDPLVEFTRKQYLEVWRDDRFISRHTSRIECGEAASADAIINDEGVYEIRVGSEVWYEVIIRHLTQQQLGDLIIRRNDSPPTNNPPVWDSQPAPIFVEGTASNYSLVDLTSDPDLDSVDVTLNTGAVSLPTGVTYNTSLDRLEYDGVGTVDTTTGHIATADDLTDTTDSDSFSIVINDLVFPRIGADLIGNRDHTLVAEPGPSIRAAMKLVDYCNVGMPRDGPWDNGDSSRVQRQAYEDDILGVGSNVQYLTYYTDVMESGPESGHYYYAQTGPTGAGNHWDAQLNGKLKNGTLDPLVSDVQPDGPAASQGDPINDWWGRAPDGHKRSTFNNPGNNPYNVNITDWVTPDGSSRRVSEYYADEHLTEMFYTTTDKDGTVGSVGVYGDVMDYRAKTSTIDWNGDGIAEDAQDGWNDGTINQTAAEKWRDGHKRYVDRYRATNANMIFVCNMTTHSRSYAGTDMSVLPYVYAEYDGLLNGGHTQNHTKEAGFPSSGVLADGTFVGAGGSWQRTYNKYVQSILGSEEPKLCNADWEVDLNDEYNPTAAGSELRIARWGFATVLLDNGFFVLNHTSFNYRRVPLMDESGLINEGTTGLSQHWLGAAIDAPQRAPVQGTNIWMREFDNGLAIVNTDEDRATSATTVLISNIPGGAGTFKRIDGSQDTGHNDGTTVNGNFSLDAQDGIILERI